MSAAAIRRPSGVPGAEPIEALCATGVAVQDRFLADGEMRALRGCALARRERGEFGAARIGAAHSLQRREDIRGDSIGWLTEPWLPAEQALWQRLEDLRLALNRHATLGLFELEMHYAWYPPGAGYAAHVDQPQGHAQRRVSLVLYLNESWESSDGGQLRIFGANGAYRDVEPQGGRLVMFLTERREHAVMTTRRERLSLTGWFRARI